MKKTKDRNKEQTRRASVLFEEIGTVQDAFLAEAETYHGKSATRKRTGMFIRVLAACLLLFLGIRVWSFIGNAKNESEAEKETVLTLAELLNGDALSASHVRHVSDLSAISFFGSPALVWKADGRSGYRMLYLDADSVSSLVAAMKNTKGNVSSNPVPDEACMSECWLLTGNGMVISPYLQNTVGNVGYATFFAYSPECEPSSAFIRAIAALL